MRVGGFPGGGLVAMKAGAVRRVTCASPASFAERGAPQSPDGLTAHDCITFEGLDGSEPWTFQIGGSDEPVAVRSRLSSTPPKPPSTRPSREWASRACSRSRLQGAVRAGALAVALKSSTRPWPVSLVHARPSGLCRSFCSLSSISPRFGSGRFSHSNCVTSFVMLVGRPYGLAAARSLKFTYILA